MFFRENPCMPALFPTLTKISTAPRNLLVRALSPPYTYTGKSTSVGVVPLIGLVGPSRVAFFVTRPSCLDL